MSTDLEVARTRYRAAQVDTEKATEAVAAEAATFVEWPQRPGALAELRAAVAKRDEAQARERAAFDVWWALWQAAKAKGAASTFTGPAASDPAWNRKDIDL